MPSWAQSLTPLTSTVLEEVSVLIRRAYALLPHILVHQFGNVRVVAYKNHHWRNMLLAWRNPLKVVESLLPLAGKLLKGALSLAIHVGRLGLTGLSRQEVGRLKTCPDRLPELEILRIGKSGRIHHRHSRDLDDAARDCINETKVVN